MGEDVYFLEHSDTYTVNPCMGEERIYISIICIAAEDVYVLVFEENISCSASEIGVAGGPS